MDATAVLVIVGLLLVAALVIAFGGFDRVRPARRTTVVERPVRRVVEERRVVEPPL